MASHPADRRTNHLLAALPEAEWQRWLPELESIDMPLGQVLYESGNTLSHVYFPITSIVSRGRITVLDRAGLERRTCECYAVVKKEYDRLLPATRAT